MRILGFYDDHNASAAVIEDGQILVAIEEERLSRIKLHDGNTDDGPAHRSIAACLKISKSERSNPDPQKDNVDDLTDTKEVGPGPHGQRARHNRHRLRSQHPFDDIPCLQRQVWQRPAHGFGDLLGLRHAKNGCFRHGRYGNSCPDPSPASLLPPRTRT